MAGTIEIYRPGGDPYMRVIITPDCKWEEELMQSDQGSLSWQDNRNEIIPAGSYIIRGNERYLLLSPYEPEQKDECTWEYNPVFESRVMSWKKAPFFHYNYMDGKLESRETDWSLTDTPYNFMQSIVKAIEDQTGEKWTYSIDANLVATATVSFQSVDIITALNNIANAFETEWIAYKDTNELRLGAIERGDGLDLRVGDNGIAVPDVTNNSEEYFNRFYAFGSTRNITQDYASGSTNNIVNKRLTLDPTKYPDGYKDIRMNPDEPILSKSLIFDEIYPKSQLKISNVRARLMYKLGDDGEKKEIGTDDNGNPIYDQYAIWYFQIPGFKFNNSTYSKDNPDGMLIKGKDLSAHFKTGMLDSREFVLTYHDKPNKLTNNTDGAPFEVLAGDYEIHFVEDNGFIVPSTVGIVPKDGDEVILFNIRMPKDYVDSAQIELEKELDKKIRDYQKNKNSYTFNSLFLHYKPDTSLYIGRKINFINESDELDTRIIKLITQMDYEFEQEITVGNNIKKGTTETLKEEVVNANRNIDILAELNALTQNITQSYNRSVQLMLDGFDRIGRMWQFDDDGNIFTPFTAYSKGNMSALGATTEAGTGGTGGGGGGGSLFGLMRDWPAADPGKSTEDALGANLGWELRQGLADARTLLDTHVADSVRHITGAERTRWNKAATDLSAIMGSDGDNVLNKWEEIVAFLATYTEADTLANLLSNKADKSQLSGYVTLDTEQKITGQKIFGTHMLIDCPWDTHDRYLFFREGGTSTYGGYVKYCGDDRLRIGTRNGDETVDVEAIEIKRGSTKVWLKGDVDIAGYTTVGNGLSVTGTVTADTIKRRGGTSLQLLTADGGIRTLHTLGAVGNLGWSGTSGQVVSINTLAHWDGRFAGGSGNSNLLYCAKGAFGDIVTRNTADFTVWAHGHKITKGTQYVLLGVCPPTSDSTYDSLHITGDFGGLNSNGRCAVDVYVGRRNGTYFRGFVNHESPENWDIGINDAGEVYLIFYYQWCAYNLNLFALQAEIKWDGKVSTPTDTNFVLLSESDSVAHFNDIRFKGISNVAVRLERVSRLWGRPFDGTGDVTGSLTSVTDITMSGKLTIGGCEITWDAAQGALRFSTSAYSEGEMAGKGATSDSGSSSGGSSGGGSYDRLDSWAAYSADKAGYVLSALLGYDLHTRLTQAASDISSLRSSVNANAGNITSLGNRLTAIEGLDIAELSDIEAAKTAVKNDVAKLYVTALGLSGEQLTWTKNGGVNKLTIPYATETTRLRSVVAGDIATIRYHMLTYLSGGVKIGTDAGQAREGSHPEFGTWSYPRAGVYDNGTVANIQALRLTWSGGYFHEIMLCPNKNDLWHRSVNNGKAGEWERFITTGNMQTQLGGAYRLRRRYTVDLSHLDTGTFYPVLFAGDKLELDCEISSPSKPGTDPWNNNHIHFIVTSWGWADVKNTFSMLSCGNYDNNEITIGSVLRGTKQGFSCVFLRGGIIYDVIANREPELKETGYTGYTGEAYMPGADITGGDNVSTQVLWRNDGTRDEKTVVIRKTLTDELATLGNSLRSEITSLGNTLRGEITTLGNTLRSEAASKYVTLSTGQTITGIKRFAPECLRVEGENSHYKYIKIFHTVNTGIPTADKDREWKIYHAADGSNFRGLAIWSYDGDGKIFNQVARFESVPTNALRVIGDVIARRFIRENGTSAMFLKGDGSVDTTSYLPRSVFDELFVKELQADGSYAIRAKFTLYSDGEVASKGAASGQGTGGSGVSYDRLDSWNDYDASAGAVLSATLGYGLLSDINALRTDVTALKGGAAVSVTTTGTGNAITAISKSGTTITATKGATFLTSHQSLDYINYLGNVAALGDTELPERGLRFYGVYKNGYPAYYGNLLRLGGLGKSELVMGWTADSNLGRIYYRSKRDIDSQAWSEWGTVAWLSDITSALSSYQPKGDYQTPNGYVASLYSANALPLKSNSLQYYSGQPTKDLCFEGSSTDLSLWSYPGPGITSVGENSVNIQSLRMWFGSMWLNEIFCSPNANGLWYRHAVNNSTATHEWERLLSDANFHTVTGKDYVRIIGDKMTGRLTAPSIGINGAGSTAYLTADAAHNAYINIGGVNLMVWQQGDMSIRAGTSQHDKVTLGTSVTRWKNVYATTINVSSTELVSKLNADMVDGHHEGDFLINRGGNYQGLLYDIPCKSFYSGHDIEDAPGAGWISGIVIGANFNSNHFQAHLVHRNDNDKWYVGRTYTDGKMTGWREIAFTNSNVASAIRLQTTRSIWGQGFNGTGDVNGQFVSLLELNGKPWISDQGQVRVRATGTAYCAGFGVTTEGVAVIQGGHAGVGGIPLLLNPYQSNSYVGIGTWTPAYTLDVGGSFCAAGAAQMNSTLTVDGAATLKSAVTVNGQLTATGNAIARGTLDVNGILTATNKVRLYDELFFEPAGNAGPYLSPAGGKLSIAFHDNYTWVKTPIVLDKDGLLTLDGQLKIGGIIMSYDASQGALRIDGNAYTTGGFAALGIPTLGAQYSETFVGRLYGSGETDEPVGAVIDFNDLSSLEAYTGLNANGEEDVLFNLGYLNINGGVVKDINGRSYADYGKIALAVTPLMVEKINQIDTSRTNMQKDIDDLKRRVSALEHI